VGSTSTQKRTRADRRGRTNCLTAGEGNASIGYWPEEKEIRLARSSIAFLPVLMGRKEGGQVIGGHISSVGPKGQIQFLCPKRAMGG
jgi:hypothetical protein